MHAGGLDKLADIISPSAETLSTQEAAVGALQKTLKSAQAALEGRQAAVFGEQVRLPMTRRYATLHCFCYAQTFPSQTFVLATSCISHEQKVSVCIEMRCKDCTDCVFSWESGLLSDADTMKSQLENTPSLSAADSRLA